MINKFTGEVYKIYTELQEKNARELRDRKKLIHSTIPTYAEYEKEISNLSISLVNLTISNDKNKIDEINKIKEKILTLREKKYELLVANGYPVDFLEEKYHCPLCKDTGFINTTRCKCFKKHLTKLYYENSNIKSLLSDGNFKNFKLQYFSNKPTGDSKRSPQSNMQDILEKVGLYINNFETINDNLLFYGRPGTGKSFMSQCIAKELLDKGFLVVYRTASDLIEDLRDIRFNKDNNLYDLIFNCDLLIIDDLGSEGSNEFITTELFNLINKKLLSKSKMLINTNLSLSEISTSYSSRITSRLMGDFKLFKFYGDDLRIKLNLKRKNL